MHLHSDPVQFHDSGTHASTWELCEGRLGAFVFWFFACLGGHFHPIIFLQDVRLIAKFDDAIERIAADFVI